MPPEAVEKILDYCERRIAGFQQSNHTGLIEIRCCPYQGQYKVECRCGDYQYFPIAREDLAVWNTPPLSRQRETLETVEQVLAKLNSALFETFRLQQGYATILILHSADNGRYGFQFWPSVVHGIKPWN
ncbi:MAG: hypothetical protein HXY43_02200 [Fischerella sp.]|jgi:hypothetical protein|uniref:hypothetical protein n=1 Tax=unclassified Fischerella TaxID=494603 RepID=UPI00047C2C8A|nr:MULTISPECIES: hypothetical protein [unclassified Fischerella]NWF58147.1 hypothetical protein [Fischerella sp.]